MFEELLRLMNEYNMKINSLYYMNLEIFTNGTGYIKHSGETVITFNTPQEAISKLNRLIQKVEGK